ncbi:pyridoxamine 5'-phosphate oxidase family protein [Halosimplex aquaticum]|uniref:Pyridoxamine 5'-phosphate oxidase family protein n=1 Tax=Halosimplex aquaticum TaxID=3026162 RepID=A0ABD5Y6U2_9EURY|nr:pyridoxamine 5'-phosphate oxidase family protein [Halosimplex aquaticum]
MEQTVPAEVEELLTGDPVVAHLATYSDGRPHAAPVWFRYEPADETPDDEGRPPEPAADAHEGGVIEVMTTGQKLENVRENPRVALSIEEDEDGHPSWMATIRGTGTVVEDDDENREANRRINRRYGADDPDDWEEENTLVRIAVGSVSYKTF